MPDPGTRAFTVRNLAEHWQVSTTHIYNLIAAGQLGHLRIGFAIRIRREDVEAFETRTWRARNERPNFRLVRRGDRYSTEFWWEGRARRVSTVASDERAARRAPVASQAGWGKAEPPAQPTIEQFLNAYARDRKANPERPLGFT